jgi:uncharacterized protein (DUF433 family)
MKRAILDAPAYRIQEAADYLRLPAATLRAWAIGRNYPVSDGMRRFQPIIEISDPEKGYLSFTNLVEAHVLSAIRRQHNISFHRVRDAVHFLRGKFGSNRPLIDQQFVTDGIDLFVEKLGGLVNVSRRGQGAMREILELHLRRIERNPMGVPIRLFPFTRSKPELQITGTVVIDPAVSYGRPIIRRLGVPTAMIAERYKAGECVDDLVADYGAERDEIEEAIRCELQVRAA